MTKANILMHANFASHFYIVRQINVMERRSNVSCFEHFLVTQRWVLKSHAHETSASTP